ncbi:hypothetical protein H0H92_003467 [Tricholoma furcatifolium]|nr:hypothetical protein H0H92_003467 [Tricholoma furcatifolium]
MSGVRAGKTDLLQEFESLLNIQLLLNDNGVNWFHHIERKLPGFGSNLALMDRLAASTVLAAGFGMHCPTGDEPDLKELLELNVELAHLFTPNSTIINAFPFLDLIPWRMPWKTRAKAIRERNDALYEKLLDEAINGKASEMNTWAALFAGQDKPEGDQRHLMKQFAATASSLQTLILACIRYPEWMYTAQKEIDNVVGSDRLPSFKDRPYLPYVEAVVRETLRWRPAARFGLPHVSTADDVIEHQGHEYHVPRGSIVFAVTWWDLRINAELRAQ